MVGGCEEARQRLSASNTHLRQRITQLEVEIVALREFVADFDQYYRWAQVCDNEGCMSPEALLPLLTAAYDTRERLSTQLGIPLPSYPTFDEMCRQEPQS